MATPKLKDLESYVRKSGRLCGVCISEHRTFMEQAFAQDYGLSTIVRYLNDQFNAGLSPNGVRRHFRERHHEQAKTKRS
jgi:hypothetical protein